MLNYLNYEQGRAYALSSISQEILHNPDAFKTWCNGLVEAFARPERPQGHVAVPTVTIFTDGSCLGNPGNGGWGAILQLGEHRRELSGAEARTTNNRMELMAVICAIEALKRPANVIVYTDSSYVQTNFPRLQTWKDRDWKSSTNRDLLNVDLWKRLEAAVAAHCVSIAFEKVKGHAGNPDNERCDVLAKEAAKQLIDAASAA